MFDAAGLILHKNIQLLKPLGFNDYNALQLHSKAVLSDSGTISEESSILHFPALNIRQAHERPEAMEEASVMMVGLNPERVLQGLIHLESQTRGVERSFRRVADYSMPNVSEKMVRIIISYTDYIKRVVWSQEI
jgi:UDP-N-acetylglucosamine 2-epimerase (non-hydrolysing)